MKLLMQWCFAALVGGIGLGAVLGYYEARPWAFSLEADGALPVDSEVAAALAPSAEVSEPTFHFGRMQRGTRRRHTFEVSNSGAAPLEVKFASSTCKCTAVEMNGEQVEVGDAIQIDPSVIGQITLEWEAKDPSGQFRHGASFQTNDPNLRRFSLEVEGDIVDSTMLRPTSLRFGDVQAGEPATETLYVMSSLEPDVEILDHQVFGDERLAEWLTIRTEKAEQSELPNSKAVAGAKVIAELDAGGAVGSFQGTLVLTTNLKQAPEMVVPIHGLVRGEISVFGKDFNREAGVLRMGSVKGSDGARAELMVNVRGEHAQATQLEVARVDPSLLQVSIGEAKRLGETLKTFPLIIEVPKGTRPIVRAGGDEGEIVLSSNHPQAQDIRIRVRLVVRP